MAEGPHNPENYMEVDIQGLLARSDTLAVDLYIRLGGHYTKICNKNEIVDGKRFESYFKKGVKNLYIHLSEKASYFFASQEYIKSLVQEEKLSPNQILRAVLELSEQAFFDLKSENFFQPEALDKAFQVTGNCLRFLSQEQDLVRQILRLCRSDNFLGMHAVSTAVIANLIAQSVHQTQEPFLRQLTLACLFHDVGLGELPVEIAEPLRNLTGNDYIEMKTHLSKAASLLSNPLFEPQILTAIEEHHENFDGSGYPNGKSGEGISLMGRILMLADSFSALNTSRGHNPKLATSIETMKLIEDEMNRFDPKLVEGLKGISKAI